MDTLSERWAKLEPTTIVVGPDDDVTRPAVLLFHGCGGMRPHLPLYAAAAKAAGWRAFIVDSYTPRGWGRMFALSMVCTGALLRGNERGGDVLAAIDGISRRSDVDSGTIAVAGWSHGGWGIMEMLAAPRTHRGELGIADPSIVSLSGLKGAWLAYPYVGFLALARNRPWRHHLKTEVMIAKHDHLTTVRNAEQVFSGHRGHGVAIETWIADGTHSFDEPTGAPPMRHDPALTEVAVKRFGQFLSELS